MTVDESEFEECVGSSANRLVPHPGEASDLARTHGQVTVEHGEGHGHGSGSARDGLRVVLEDMHALDPAEECFRERGPVGDRHEPMVTGLARSCWRTAF